MYCAAMVYVPSCSGLSGRVIATLLVVLRNCSAPIATPLGRVTVNCTEPVGVAAVLLTTVAVIEGVPVVSVGFCELVSVVVVVIAEAGAAAAASRADSTRPASASAHSGASARNRDRPTHPPRAARAAHRADAGVF